MRNSKNEIDVSGVVSGGSRILIRLLTVATFLFSIFMCVSAWANDDLSPSEIELVKSFEQHRIGAINQVIGSVVAIYDEDRKGGGSGVIIDASGLALTNHHVIMGAGVEGWGGLADGKMYKWKLIGTDPGGDVSLIQMVGKEEFPFTPLGNSDDVRVGDWAMAMGNPFILTEDQSPTVTLGIVSGVKRYQHGAGLNQLVYGNCIQVDSSINPGNSGGPLFNLNGEVIGINGRGSFKERGRVNVGLGYAISANQIKNFIPDLLATKLVEHATLDASFSDRNGKVLCSTINLDSPVAQAGLKLGDELLEFEGTKIENANQFTNLICTLPEDWPARLKVRSGEEDSELTIQVRTLGLPYKKPKVPKSRGGGKERTPEQEKQQKRQRQMIALLAAPPGEVRFKGINKKYAQKIVRNWQSHDGPAEEIESYGMVELTDVVKRDGEEIGKQKLWLASDGRFCLDIAIVGEKARYVFDGKKFYSIADETTSRLSLIESKLNLPIVQAVSMAAAAQRKPFSGLGDLSLDGSGRAVGQNAYRMKLVDDDDDGFFVWISMYGDDGRPSSRLLKAAADKDCDDKGGVTFHDWKGVGPLKIPHRREFVSGLDEKQIMAVVNQDARWVEEIDEDLFVVDFKEEESETSDSDSKAEEAEDDEAEDDEAEDDEAEDDEAVAPEMDSDDGEETESHEAEDETEADSDSDSDSESEGSEESTEQTDEESAEEPDGDDDPVDAPKSEDQE